MTRHATVSSILSVAVIIAASVAAFAKDTGNFSVGCLTNDVALQTAEGLTASDPAATVAISPASLWPPNHKLRNVGISMSLPSNATALGSPVDVSLTVNNITDDQVGDDNSGGGGCGAPTGKQGADWSPTDFSGLVASGSLQSLSDSVAISTVELRAERCAKDGTRTYEISVTCCDTTNAVCDSVPEVLEVVTRKSQGHHGHP